MSVLNEQSFKVLSLTFVRCFSLSREHPGKFVLFSPPFKYSELPDYYFVSFSPLLYFQFLVPLLHFQGGLFKWHKDVIQLNCSTVLTHREKEETVTWTGNLLRTMASPSFFFFSFLFSYSEAQLFGSEMQWDQDLIFSNFILFLLHFL